MSIHFILVRYDASQDNKLSNDLLNQFKSFREVLTSEPSGRFVKNINEAFEFSGYQEGLALVLEEINLLEKIEHEERHAIVMANDTIFSGHFNLLTRFVLHNFAILNYRNSSQIPRLTGLVMNLSPEITTVVKASGYVSSWLFMLEGTIEQLQKVRFYNSEIRSNNFIQDYYQKFPDIYRRPIDAWLQPSHLLRGWYQALPGRPLPQSTLDRKRFAIYLEHSLPSQVGRSGFEMSCLSQRLSLFSRTLLRILRLMDRCYVNLLKLRRRLWAIASIT